jgi:hypothetical protein
MPSALVASLIGAALPAADQAEPLLKRLDPVLRTKVLMALAALLILAGASIALLLLWTRYVKRRIRQPFPASRAHEDDWYNKPLVKPRDDKDDENDNVV